MEGKDGVKAHVLPVIGDLGLGRHHKAPKRRILPPLSVELGHRFYSFRRVCWLGGQLSSLYREDIFWVGMQHGIYQVCVMCKTRWYVSSLEHRLRKHPKKAHRLFGGPDNQFPYPQKVCIFPSWIILIIYLSLAVDVPWGGSHSKNLGLTRRGWPERYSQRALAMGTWVAWVSSPACPVGNDVPGIGESPALMEQAPLQLPCWQSRWKYVLIPILTCCSSHDEKPHLFSSHFD